MKCEGVENPPCIRCAKVGRECIPQTSTRKTARTSRPPTQQYPTVPSSHLAKTTYTTPLKELHQLNSIPSTSPTNARSSSTSHVQQSTPSHQTAPPTGDAVNSSTNET